MSRYHMTVWFDMKEVVRLIYSSKDTNQLYLCQGQYLKWNQAHFEYLFKKNRVAKSMKHLFDGQKLPPKLTIESLVGVCHKYDSLQKLSDTSAILKIFENHGLEKTQAYAVLKKISSVNFHEIFKSNKAYETDLPYKFDVEPFWNGIKVLESGQFNSDGNLHGLGYRLWLFGEYAGMF